MTDQVTIDIYSDVVCPWCVIGYGQLTKALAELDGEIEAEIRWLPFELNPTMSSAGEPLEAHLQRKYGRTAAEGEAARGRMKAIAEEAGVSLSYEGEGEPPVAMMWNTRDCHKLLAFAYLEAGPAVQTKLKLALFKAHFNERKNLADRDILLDIAAESGLHREAAKAALDDKELETRVIQEEGAAWDHNITGVPAMIVNRKFMIPGAQAPDVYANALRRVVEKSRATASA